MGTVKSAITGDGQTQYVFCEMIVQLNQNKSWNSWEMIPRDFVLLSLREHCHLVQTEKGQVMFARPLMMNVCSVLWNKILVDSNQSNGERFKNVGFKSACGSFFILRFSNCNKHQRYPYHHLRAINWFSFLMVLGLVVILKIYDSAPPKHKRQFLCRLFCHQQ